jgi:hypothetical protein
MHGSIQSVPKDRQKKRLLSAALTGKAVSWREKPPGPEVKMLSSRGPGAPLSTLSWALSIWSNQTATAWRPFDHGGRGQCDWKGRSRRLARGGMRRPARC